MKPGGGGTHLESQNLGGRGRRISVSSRPAWSTRASSRTGSKATEKPCLKTKKKKNKQKTKQTKKTHKCVLVSLNSRNEMSFCSPFLDHKNYMTFVNHYPHIRGSSSCYGLLPTEEPNCNWRSVTVSVLCVCGTDCSAQPCFGFITLKASMNGRASLPTAELGEPQIRRGERRKLVLKSPENASTVTHCPC